MKINDTFFGIKEMRRDQPGRNFCYFFFCDDFSMNFKNANLFCSVLVLAINNNFIFLFSNSPTFTSSNMHGLFSNFSDIIYCWLLFVHKKAQNLLWKFILESFFEQFIRHVDVYWFCFHIYSSALVLGRAVPRRLHLSIVPLSNTIAFLSF